MIIPRRKPYFSPKILIKAFHLIKSTPDIVKSLEKKLEKELRIGNVICVASGRVGLYLILKHSGLKKGTEILIPGLTFGTLRKFIEKAGYKPVTIDIDPKSFQMDPDLITKAINTKTSAILATHIFGAPCDIVKIKKIAKKHNLLLIEDCAEALGATVNGKSVGMFGDISLASFDIAKPLQGIRGGIVFGKNKRILASINKYVLDQGKEKFPTKEVARAVAGYFISQTFVWPLITCMLSFKVFREFFVHLYRKVDQSKKFDLKLNPHLARLTYINCDGYMNRINNRRKIVSIYTKRLGDFINFQVQDPNELSNYYMVVGTINTDLLKLRRYLAIRGIDIAINNEVADNCMQSGKSITKEVYGHAIALPIYETLTKKQISYISRVIKSLPVC